MALITSAPTSQKAGERPISFHLDDGGTIRHMALVVRPEDLTRVEPSRMSLQQTLSPDRQGWLDNFGPGLPTISISGHTGWRDYSGSGDGLKQFDDLNKLVMVDWHAKRQQKINAGQDPDTVKLIFIDKLDSFAYVVAPQSFTLRRSKSRPLLMQYQISLQAISTSVDAGTGSIFGADMDFLSSLGLDSLKDVLGTIGGYANTISGWISGSIGAAAGQFLKMSSNVLGVVTKVVGTAKGAIDKVTGSFLGAAGDIMKAGRNLFMSVSAVMSLPALAKQRLMQIASAFNTAFCVLKNVFKIKKTLPNFADWYGASTCSSTAGGSPLSPLRNTNAFYLLKSNDTASISMSQQAATATRTAASLDPVLSTPSLSQSADMMREMSTIGAAQ